MTTRKRSKASGEGSVYKDTRTGNWTACVTVGWVGGKQQRKKKSFPTYKEAERGRRRMLADMERGLPIIIRGGTLESFMATWLLEAVKPKVAPATYESYEYLARVHILPTLGPARLERLIPEAVLHLLNAKGAEGLSVRTVRYMHAVLKMALDQAERWGLVARNVAKLVDGPHPARSRVRVMQPEQVRALLKAVQGDRLEVFYVLALGLGLRRGELLALRWENVDLDTALLHVRESLDREGGHLVTGPPKTVHSIRTLALPAALGRALRNQITHQKQDAMAAGKRWQETRYVVTTSIGTPLDPRAIKRHLDATLAQAGLPHFTIHELRHTAASLMADQGLDLKAISGILGHASISITADLYVHFFEHRRRDDAAKMDEFFGA